MDYRSINITSQKMVKQANNNHFCSKLVSLYTSLSAFWQKFTIFCIFVDFTHYNIDAVSNTSLSGWSSHIKAEIKFCASKADMRDCDLLASILH